jgi:hypothetical protein
MNSGLVIEGIASLRRSVGRLTRREPANLTKPDGLGKTIKQMSDLSQTTFKRRLRNDAFANLNRGNHA